MMPVVDAVAFLVSVYWPFMAAACLVGVITGWLSLGREPGGGQP